MPKLSVIIPIYKVEEYLPKCLDCLINQTFKDFEAICVNDCSPDNSEEVLKEYQKKDNRIKIVNRKTNGGLSAARNSGLDVAEGEYIYFYDSDDWIDNNYLEVMVDAIEKTQTEVVLNTNILTHKGNVEPYQHMEENTLDSATGIFVTPQECVLKLIWNSWAYIWKKSFLDRINARFPEGYVMEDMYFQTTTLPFTDRIYVIRDAAYHYLVREKSITTDALSNNTLNENILKCYVQILKYFKDNNLTEKINHKIFGQNIISFNLGSAHEKYLYSIKDYFTDAHEIIERTKDCYNEMEYFFFNMVYNNFDEVLGIDGKDSLEDCFAKKIFVKSLISNLRNKHLKRAVK